MAKNSALKAALQKVNPPLPEDPKTTPAPTPAPATTPAATPATTTPAATPATTTPAPTPATTTPAADKVKAIYSTLIDTQTKKDKAEQLKTASDSQKAKLQQEIEDLEKKIQAAKKNIKNHDSSIKDALKDITGADNSLTDLVKNHARTPVGTCQVSILQDMFKQHNLWPMAAGKPIGITKLSQSSKPTEQALGKAFKTLNTLCDRINKQEIAAGNGIGNKNTPTAPATIIKDPTAPTPAAANKPAPTVPAPAAPAATTTPAPAAPQYDLWQEIHKQIKKDLTDKDLDKLIFELCKDPIKRVVIKTAWGKAELISKQSNAK